MEEKFRNYLTKLGLKGASTNYPQAINLISQHYSSHTGKYTDIYSLRDLNLLESIVNDYEQSGRFSKYGYEHHGRYRAAIKKYFEFFRNQNIDQALLGKEIESEYLENENIDQIIESSFTYEKDLQKSLCLDVEILFPEYEIFGTNNEGIEFSIKGKRIDVLLSNKETGDLLAIELKSGVADFKVFGQISMYIGLLKNKFPDRNIKGIIIAGTIDETLSYACSTSNLITLKTYKMKLQLNDINLN